MCLITALASPEFITKLIIITNMFLASSSIWMDSNSFKDFSNTVWCLELFLFSVLFELGSDIWVLLLSVIIFHRPLSGLHPIGWLGALLFSLVSILSYSLRFLGVLRRRMLLISGSAYPQGLSSPKENARFDGQSCEHFSTIFGASKNSPFLWIMIWVIPSVF
jgi:hypothetical protein